MSKKNIIFLGLILVIVLLGMIWFNKPKDLIAPTEPAVTDESFTLEESRDIAEKWIVEKSPTYSFDGYGLNLISESALEDGVYYFLFAFESTAAGYGDRTEQMLAQVITPHQMEVTVKEGEVVNVVTDNIFCEISEENI